MGKKFYGGGVKKLLALAFACAMCLAVCSCMFVAVKESERVDVAPPKMEAKVTLPENGVAVSGLLTNGIAVKMTPGMTADMVTVSVSDGLKQDGTINIDELGNAVIKVTPESVTDADETKNVKIKVTRKDTGAALCDETIEYKTDSWRYFEVGGTEYKFDLVKQFHFELPSGKQAGNDIGSKDNSSNGGYATWTTSGRFKYGDDVIKYDHTALDGNKSIFTFWASANKFEDFDYIEIKFKSESSQASKFAYSHYAGGMCVNSTQLEFYYSEGKIGVCNTDGGFDGTQKQLASYTDSSADWQTVGFWNDTESSKCLFVDNTTASEDTFNDTTALPYKRSGDTLGVFRFYGPTEIHYVSFYKKVN